MNLGSRFFRSSTPLSQKSKRLSLSCPKFSLRCQIRLFWSKSGLTLQTSGNVQGRQSRHINSIHALNVKFKKFSKRLRKTYPLSNGEKELWFISEIKRVPHKINSVVMSCFFTRQLSRWSHASHFLSEVNALSKTTNKSNTYLCMYYFTLKSEIAN